MKVGFYMDNDGCLYLVKPGKKGEYYSDHFGGWQKWTGSYENFLSWITPEHAEYIGV